MSVASSSSCSSRPRLVLVGGTDPCGGAGLPADLRACEALGCWGFGVVTAVVVQSTLGVRRFEVMSPELVAEQWDCVLDDAPTVSGAKLGMLGSAAVARVLGPRLAALQAAGCPVVYDPVLASGHGVALSGDALVEAVREVVLPAVTVLTPNVPEAERVLGLGAGSIIDLEGALEAAAALCALGPRAVLLKGGHLPGAPGDVLVVGAGERRSVLSHGQLPGALDIHGTGCHLASALACGLARGERIEEAAAEARAVFLGWLAGARLRPGRGREILDARRGGGRPAGDQGRWGETKR